MSLVVKNNMSALRSLNTLNTNSSKLAKSLKKVSSGMKITGSADGTSEYGISERMRVQIRGLEQANSNAQSANSLLKVADGAISNTVDILRTMKEKAINSANDTNTDTDRALIQKELDQLIDQVNDNALVTFNGKYLFTGDADKTYYPEQTVVAALHSEWLASSLDMIERATGLTFEKGDPYVDEMEVLFEDDPSSSALAYVTTWMADGKHTSKLTMTVNMAYYSDIIEGDVNGNSLSAYGAYLDRTIAHEMTHAVMSANIESFTGGDGLYAVLKEGAAEVIHGIDDERKGKIQSLANSGLTGVLGAKSKTASGEDEYAAGYILYRYMAAAAGDYKPEDSMKRFMHSLAISEGDIDKRINDAVSAATKGYIKTYDDLVTAMGNDRAAAGSGDAFLKQYCNINLDNEDTGSILGSDAGGRFGKNAEEAVWEAGSTKYWTNPTADDTYINGLHVKWPDGVVNIKGGLYFQIGTKAAQNLHMTFSNMDAQAMGLQDKNGKNIQVTSQKSAQTAIYQLERSIERALEQHTLVGAMATRLDFTSSNLTISHENVTAAESVIRDADMAKEMTEYTKNNVLMQAAQSMLAQANQNSSGALSLLQ